MPIKADVHSCTERNAHYKLQDFNLNLMFLLSHRCLYNIYNIHCHHNNIFQMLLLCLILLKKILNASGFLLGDIFVICFLRKL